MKRNMIKRIAAVAMAGAMMVSMSVPTMADGEQIEKTNVIQKSITKGNNVYTPNTSFTFSVTPGTGHDADIENNIPKVENGLPEGAYIPKDSKITFAPDQSKLTDTTVTSTAGITIAINKDIFKNAGYGIYRYNVTEVTPNPKYDGMSYSTQTKFLDVYYSKAGFDYLFTNENSTGKDDGTFVNDYVTGILTVTKAIGGDQAKPTDEFEFTITINGADGEMYHVEYGASETAEITSGTPTTIKLQGGEKAEIYGLSAEDSYTVEEADYSSIGYTTTVENKPGRTYSATFKNDNQVDFKNVKNPIAPTGIVMDIAPYIIMVAAAGVLAFVFLRRRSYTK